jgi:hypothetical protein
LTCQFSRNFRDLQGVNATKNTYFAGSMIFSPKRRHRSDRMP